MHQSTIPWYVPKLVLPMGVLVCFSLTILGSINTGYVLSQSLSVGLAAVLFYVFASLDYRIFTAFPWLVYALANVPLAAIFIFGTHARGSLRWLELGGLRYQPSEAAKILLILFFAALLSRQTYHTLSSLWLIIGTALLPLLLIFFQPDLGTTLIVTAIIASLTLASRVPKKYLVLFGAGVLVLAPLIWALILPYQKDRLHSFIAPAQDPLGRGYNAIQAVIAVGSGRFMGRGLGQGTQSQLHFLPERQTDFIFAAISEEFGFLGSATLIGCYIYLLYAIAGVVRQTKDEAGRLIAVGAFCLLGLQAFINIGMNMGLVPITGITLPLVSLGGSSLITTAILLGMVGNIGNAPSKPSPKLEIK